MIENTQRITEIKMKPFAECKCVIGQDWYHIDYDVDFIPGNFYPDYMKVSAFIADEINGRELNIEDAVDKLGKYLEGYGPKKLIVRADVKNVTSHCPVIVTKEY